MLEDLHRFCHENMTKVGQGCGRMAFVNPYNPDWVIKVPRDLGTYDTYGLAQQQMEVKTLHEIKHYPFAPKFWVEEVRVRPCYDPEDTYTVTVPIIHMERADDIPHGHEWWTDYDSRPAWSIGIYDGCQAGRTKDGRIVPRDLGSGISEGRYFDFKGTVRDWYRTNRFG